MRLSVAAACAALVSMIGTAAGVAALETAAGGPPVILYNSADQAAAKFAVINLGDFGGGPGWKGGPQRPNPSTLTVRCRNYHPTQSDLVVTGAARTVYRNRMQGLFFDTSSRVLQTREMVALDWNRSVAQPGLAACLRRTFVAQLRRGQRLVAVRRLALPGLDVHPNTQATRFRFVVSEPAGKGRRVRVITDVVFEAYSRAEVSAVVLAAAKDRQVIDSAERSIVAGLAERSRT